MANGLYPFGRKKARRAEFNSFCCTEEAEKELTRMIGYLKFACPAHGWGYPDEYKSDEGKYLLGRDIFDLARLLFTMRLALLK